MSLFPDVGNTEAISLANKEASTRNHHPGVRDLLLNNGCAKSSRPACSIPHVAGLKVHAKFR